MCASTFFLSIAHFIDMFTLPCELCELYKYFFYIFDELREKQAAGTDWVHLLQFL